MAVEVVNADIMEWCKTYEGPKAHACLCDPPYCLSSISKRFGKPNSTPAQEGTDGAYRRASTGFMGMAWDNEIAFDPETWVAIKQHLYPGAFICAFNGSRSWHRMACAMEDAGLILHPTIFLYSFSTGFPKATNIAKAIDKREGAEQAVISVGRSGKGCLLQKMQGNSDYGGEYNITQAATQAATQWKGHRYGLQAMKPSVEPIILVQVPYVGKPIDCIVNTGAGALNIDGARIGVNGGCAGAGAGAAITCFSGGLNGTFAQPVDGMGRWPSNLIIDTETAYLLDAQTGTLTSGKPCGVSKAKNNIYGEYGTGMPITGFGDSGGASRFFFSSNWNAEVQERIDEANPLFYTSKASSTERKKSAKDDLSNNHPTLKPLSLTKYLATLLAPPEGYNRRLLIPFSGAGSEICGAILSQQWEHITGIEQSPDYCKIAEGRIAYWSGKSGLFAELNTDEEEEGELQVSLEDMFNEEAP